MTIDSTTFDNDSPDNDSPDNIPDIGDRTVRSAPTDVNTAFAAERAAELAGIEQRNEGIARRRRQIEDRVASGALIPLGGNQYRINDPGSMDNGEVWAWDPPTARLRPRHQLDESNGQAALYSRVPAWHGLGDIVPDGVSDIGEVLHRGRIDFDVVKQPVLYRAGAQPIGAQQMGRVAEAAATSPQPGSGAAAAGGLASRDPGNSTNNGTNTDGDTDGAGDGPLLVWAKQLPEQFVTVRTDTGAGLGVVGGKYEVAPNREVFAFLQDLIGTTDCVWESAGALRGGRRVFVCLRLPQNLSIDPGGINDQIVPFIAAINSHDGSTQAQLVVTPWRILCGNTERFAVRDATARWGVRHTRNWNSRERVEEARRALGLSQAYYQAFAAEQEALARTALDVDTFRDLCDQLWPQPQGGSVRTVTSYTRRLQALTDLYDTNTARLGATAYAAERAITQYLDWGTTVRRAAGRGGVVLARATAALEGSKDPVKTAAHRHLLTLAA